MNAKHTYFVRELCKFLAGLVLADMLFGIWVYSAGGAGQQSFFGLLLTTPLVNTWLVIDAVLFLLLIFYGWRISLPAAPARRGLLATVGAILGIVAIAHFARLFFAVPVAIGGLPVPSWLSVIGAIVAGFLSYASFHLAAKR